MFGQGIKNFFDKHRPKFEKGGKLHPFQSVFEGFETFLYVSDATTKKGSHIRDYIDLKRTKIFVLIALDPNMLFEGTALAVRILFGWFGHRIRFCTN